LSRGSTAIDIAANVFVIDNATDGYDLHRLDSGTQLRTYSIGAEERRVPKQVTFAQNGRLVIGGSSRGKVFAFDRESGKLLGTAKHGGGKDLVQTVAVGEIQHAWGGKSLSYGNQTHEGKDCSIIVCANNGKRPNISVWIRKHASEQARRNWWTTKEVVDFLTKIMVLVALGVYIFSKLTVSRCQCAHPDM